MSRDSSLTRILDIGSRLFAAAGFLFWGMFFVEHLVEWFMRADGQSPPAYVWVAQLLHFCMLGALGWGVFRPLQGAIALIIATAAFFSWIGAFPWVASLNAVPVVLAFSAIVSRFWEGQTAKVEPGVRALRSEHHFFVLKTSRKGTAERPPVSLKFLNFSLLTQMA